MSSSWQQDPIQEEIPLSPEFGIDTTPQPSASFLINEQPTLGPPPEPQAPFQPLTYPMQFQPQPIMPMANNAAHAHAQSKEFGFNKPTPFTGDRAKITNFLQECMVYLTVNRHIYNSDEAKVAFILSHMTDKEARTWKELFINKIQDSTTGDLHFPTITNFVNELKDAFKMEDLTQTAMNKLSLLKQGNKTAEELVTEFRFLAGQAQLEAKSHSDNMHMIRAFQAALNPQLARRILFGDPVPKTIGEWYTRAIQLDTNYRMALAIMGKTPNKNQNMKNQGRNWYTKTNDQKDPKAMDVDALTMDERMVLMKQGLCFKCKKRGHISRDCKEKMGQTPQQHTEQKKWAPKDLYSRIQTLEKGDKDEFLKLMMGDDTPTDF